MRRVLALLLAAGLCGCGMDADEEPADESAEPALTYVHAPGIRLTRMTINQGVQVELVAGAEVTSAEDYPVSLIADRPMLVRAHYSVHTDFEPRELVAKLRIRFPPVDGVRRPDEVQDSVVMVRGDSVEGSLHQTFAWYLTPDMVVDGLRLRVDVYELEGYEPGTEPEPEPGATGAAALDAPALPWASWDAPLRVDHDPMVMHVVLVPIEHHFEGCESNAEISDEAVLAMRLQLEQNNPVQRVEISVHDPVIWTESIGELEGFSPILSELSMRRVDEDVAPWIYWYGLVTTCDGYPDGLLGQAFGIPDEVDPALAFQRVAAGRFNGSGEAASETFIHELGHNQGRRHVRCANEAGIDVDYPYSGGITGSWGFGIHDITLHSPTGSRDYMTYCANEWVSDYGYNHSAGVIEALTTWALEAEGAGGDGLRARARSWSVADFDELLVASIEASGAVQWFTIRGGVSGELEPHAAIRWRVADEQLDLPVWIADQPDADALLLTSPLPEGGLDGARFELLVDAPDLRGVGLDASASERSLAELRRAD